MLHPTARLQYFFNQAIYSAEPGGMVAVTVSIRETFDPRCGPSLLAPDTDGLISGGVLVLITPPLPTRAARVRSTSDISGNPGFDLVSVAHAPAPDSANGVGLLELSARSPVFGEVVSRSAYCETVLLPLGTFTFTAGKVQGEVTYLTAMLVPGIAVPRDNNVTNSGFVLDPSLEPGSTMITVSPQGASSRHSGDESRPGDAYGSLVRGLRSRPYH
jgi:hypothetical protein